MHINNNMVSLLCKVTKNIIQYASNSINIDCYSDTLYIIQYSVNAISLNTLYSIHDSVCKKDIYFSQKQLPENITRALHNN